MVVDTSAVVAVLFDEPDSAPLRQAMIDAPTCTMSAATYVETAVVCDQSRLPLKGPAFDHLVETVGINIAPLTSAHAG